MMILTKLVHAVLADLGNAGSYAALIIILAILFLILIRNIRIVPQATTFILERLGAYHRTWQVGIHIKIPFIDRVAKTISLKEKVADFQPQAVITKDNVTMQIDTDRKSVV